MTTWHTFPAFLLVIGALWTAAALPRVRRPELAILAGTLVLALFVAGFWRELGRPPLRTLGETRLWFGLLLPLAALAIHRCVPWRWPLVYAAFVALAFLVYTALAPETHDRTLMPALQSPLFVPHVTVYLLGYAFLFHAAACAALGWLRARRDGAAGHAHLRLAEASLWCGFGCLTLGLLLGALWAKGAWGHYWAWDPKETWAFLTWAVYLAYLHLRPEWSRHPRRALAFLTLASLVVLACWFGVSYLPSADQSVHTYAR